MDGREKLRMHMMANDFNEYLRSDKYIDHMHPDVFKKASELKNTSGDSIDLIRRTYEFVRDGIKHSWDVQDKRVVAKASETLRVGVGICWAKSNLLAALLRANGIPAGICYQKLTLMDTPEDGYCIHALNAVYIVWLNQWIRLDARGNKVGINAQFSLDKEMLAFPVRQNFGERDYPGIYAEPAEITMQILEKSTDALDMYLHSLPEDL